MPTHFASAFPIVAALTVLPDDLRRGVGCILIGGPTKLQTGPQTPLNMNYQLQLSTVEDGPDGTFCGGSLIAPK